MENFKETREKVMSWLEDEIAIYENLGNIMPKEVSCHISNESRNDYERFNTIYDLLESTEELERLAEIGRATERFFDEDAERTVMALESNNEGRVIALGLDELIGWYMEEVE